MGGILLLLQDQLMIRNQEILVTNYAETYLLIAVMEERLWIQVSII